MAQEIKKKKSLNSSEGVRQLAARIDADEEREEAIIDHADEFAINPAPADTSLIWKSLKQQTENCKKVTNFTPQFVFDLAGEVIATTQSSTGRATILTPHDSLCLILGFYKVGGDLAPLTMMLPGMKNATDLIARAIKRIRPILDAVLRKHQKKIVKSLRPQAAQVPDHLKELIKFIPPHLAAAIDCTPLPRFKPAVGKGLAGTKPFFDSHHRLYADKVEGVVRTVAPHIAFTWSSVHRGGEPDIAVHRAPDGAAAESRFLKMSTAEVMVEFGDGADHWWAAVEDAGYMGQVNGCSFQHVLTNMTKPVEVESEVQWREVLHWIRGVRVVIEQYWGRMKRSWGLVKKPYALARKSLQSDINNIFILTNEHIVQNALTEGEGVWYRKWLSVMREKEETRLEKRRRSTAEYRKRTAREASLTAEPLVEADEDEEEGEEWQMELIKLVNNDDDELSEIPEPPEDVEKDEEIQEEEAAERANSPPEAEETRHHHHHHHHHHHESEEKEKEDKEAAAEGENKEEEKKGEEEEQAEEGDDEEEGEEEEKQPQQSSSSSAPIRSTRPHVPTKRFSPPLTHKPHKHTAPARQNK